MSDDESDAAGGPWPAYIESLLRNQDVRKSSIEQRGLAVVTTSGTIVTLLFGLVALLTRRDDFTFPDTGRSLLLLSLIFFTVAAVLGVVSNAPLDYTNADLDDDERFWRWWDESSDRSAERITATHLQLFRVAQKRNAWKGGVLIAAIVAEVAAVGSLAATVMIILDAG